MHDGLNKRCTKCGRVKPLTAFHRLTKSPDGHQAHCKRCRRAYAQRHALSSNRRQQNVRRILDHYKRMKGCADCGTTEGVLHFDHVDPATKLFCVSQGVHRSLESICAEVEKCEVRCLPCHAARHERLRKAP